MRPWSCALSDPDFIIHHKGLIFWKLEACYHLMWFISVSLGSSSILHSIETLLDPKRWWWPLDSKKMRPLCTPKVASRIQCCRSWSRSMDSALFCWFWICFLDQHPDQGDIGYFHWIPDKILRVLLFWSLKIPQAIQKLSFLHWI